MSCPCHIELVLTEKDSNVKGEPEDKTERKLSRREAAKRIRSGVTSSST
jgi:hypothetical protein